MRETNLVASEASVAKLVETLATKTGMEMASKSKASLNNRFQQLVSNHNCQWLA